MAVPSAGPVPGSAAEAPGFATPVVVFAVTRVLLLCVARYASTMLPAGHASHSLLPHTDPLAHAWLWTSPWFRFDAGWYVDVASHGYHYGSIQTTDTNFFPFYPILIRVLTPLAFGSPWDAAWFISNVAFCLGLIALWRWALLCWNRRIALRVLLLVTVFPFSFFFAAPYAEPIFLALAAAAFMWSEEERWRLAIVAAGLATVTRPVGLVVVPAVALLAFWAGRKRTAAAALLGFLPFLAFVAFLGIRTGHPLSFTVYHTYGWLPPKGGVFETIAREFNTKLSPFDRVDAAVVIIFLATVPAVWSRLGSAYALYVAGGLLLPLIKSLAGMERYATVLFPAIAVWATWKRARLQAVLFSLSLFLLLLATVMFADGYAIF